MLCAISGEAPQVPVVSTKSGNVFEKKLIETYISENGKDPITNEDLAIEDLVAIKTAQVVRPRPPTLTSIPSLLSVFQNEWDALILETFTLQQNLGRTRQDLSHALYENDAARRVIARLSKERDEARDALSKIGMNGTASNGGAMQIDGQQLDASLISKIEETQERLSKTRRKRPLPEEWATASIIQSFAPSKPSKAVFPGSHSIKVSAKGDLILAGDNSGHGGAYSIHKHKLEQKTDCGASINDVAWAGDMAAYATSEGYVKCMKNGKEIMSFKSHNGKATALALHPCGDLLASVGEDKAFVLYNLTTSSEALKTYTDSALTAAQFHPDGNLFAAGGADGQIKVYDIKSNTNAANFTESGPIKALDFSENGTWLAVIVAESTSVSIWDLRKAEKIKSIEMGGPVVTVKWDYTGQFLAAAGPGGLTIQHYEKASKEWSAPLQTAIPGVALDWGPQARSLIVLNEEGVVTVCSEK